MRIVFIGTPDFAVASLKALVEANHNIVGVVTAPDRPAGRNQKIKYSPVKEYALSQNLDILQPQNLKNPDFISELKSLKADLQIVVAFRMLPEVVWNMPPKGTFNLHASLLPNYRGAAPINHAIINGEQETGVTTFFLKHEIDTGNIILQEKVPIEADENVGSLHDKLMNIGAELLLKTTDLIIADKVQPIPQEELAQNQVLHHAPKLFKPFCELNWREDVVQIHNKVRGLSPYPCAFIHVEVDNTELQLKIFRTTIDSETFSSEICQVGNEKNKLGISNPSGTIWFEEVQLQGKKRMSISDFINGLKLPIAIQRI